MKFLQKALRIVLPLLFGVGILWFLLSKVDIAQISEIISRGISWYWVVISLSLALLSHVVRGIRWRLQIRTLGADPSTHDMSVAVFGNYGLNLLFPRLGEVWRCNYIAQTYELPFSTTLGTMISERIVDMIFSFCLAAFAFLIESHVFFEFFAEQGGIGEGIINLLTSPVLYIIVAVFVVALILCRHFLSDNPVYKYIKGLCLNIWKGILSIKELPNKWSYLVWTIILWGLYYLNSLTGLYFFDFTSNLTPINALLVFVMGSISLIAPVQGGLGAWHAMVIFTLGCYGIGYTEAFSFALVHWCIQEGFVLLLGFYAMIVVALKKNK